LPFVPVMPIIVITSLGRPKTTADIGPIAARTEPTRSWGASRSSHRSTTSAAAPASSAARAKSWPSALAPGTQKNSEPGRTSAAA